MLDAIARERDIAFIVYDGNFKGPRGAVPRQDLSKRVTTCSTRRARRSSSCPASTTGPIAGSRKRAPTTRSSGSTSCGNSSSPMPIRSGPCRFRVTRESEVARFRTFRENVRWQAQGVAFVGLNAPSPNNHYLTAGGRNGEFEDRVGRERRSGSNMRRNRRGARSSARSSSSCRAIPISRATSDATASRGCASRASNPAARRLRRIQAQPRQGGRTRFAVL